MYTSKCDAIANRWTPCPSCRDDSRPHAFDWFQTGPPMRSFSATTALFIAFCALGTLACNTNEWNRLKARFGSAEAQFALGQRAEAGAEGTPDYELAAEWYRKASEYPDAQFALSQLIARDQVEPARDGELEALLHAAAEQGHAMAQNQLGVLYTYHLLAAGENRQLPEWAQRALLRGVNIPDALLGMSATEQGAESREADHVEALKWYRAAAEQDLAAAQFNLAMVYELGRGVDRDPHAALDWCTRAAEQGLDRAQMQLGKIYERGGDGIPRDLNRANAWYRRAAEEGSAAAQIALALRYLNGSGVAVDPAEAARWFEKAAERGDIEAQISLAVLHQEGRGVAKDLAAAVKWYARAAEADDPVAANRLGRIYLEGLGVAPDPAKSIDWYHRAAEQGYVPAQLNLGALYAEGRVVAKDDARAMEWFRKAAEKGNGLGQVNLGIGYFKGQGVIRDLVTAHMWFTLSDADAADRWRENVEAKLSRDELEKSQKLVAEWRETHQPPSS
jgi:TPR repeat protein